MRNRGIWDLQAGDLAMHAIAAVLGRRVIVSITTVKGRQRERLTLHRGRGSANKVLPYLFIVVRQRIMMRLSMGSG